MSQSIRFTIEQVNRLAESLVTIAAAAQQAASVVIDAGAITVSAVDGPQLQTKLELKPAAAKPAAAKPAAAKPAAAKPAAKLADRQAAGVPWSSSTIRKLAGSVPTAGMVFSYVNRKGVQSRWQVTDLPAPRGRLVCRKLG